MAAKGGCIDFMFLSLPYPAAWSATVTPPVWEILVQEVIGDLIGFSWNFQSFFLHFSIHFLHVRIFLLKENLAYDTRKPPIKRKIATWV